MDWKNVDFDWNRARGFVATAEEGSFSGAARALGMSQPTIGRQVAALEEELGVTLFERVDNRLRLTDTGVELLEHARVMSRAAARLSLSAAGQSERLEGVVRVAASEAVSFFLLPPIVKRLRRQHPGIELELVVSNAVSDLRRREADIAVRHARPSGADMVAKLIRRETLAPLYGASSYLKRLGDPSAPGELVARAELVGFDEVGPMLSGLRALGLPFEMDSFRVRSQNHLLQWELAKRGVGLCVMMDVVGDRERRVRRALPQDALAFRFSTWLVSHRELRTSRRMRVVFDLLAEELTASLEPPG